MNKKFTTLFEHETTAGFNWTEQELLALTKMNTEVGAGVLNPVVRSGKKELKAAEYVGVVRFGNRSVQILPKIHRTESGHDEEQIAVDASRNFLTLLSYARDFPFKESDINSLLQTKSDWFEILIHLFASKLHEEWRQGAYRNYRNVTGILPVLKGKWQISRQIKKPLSKTVFDVAYDEFTADNPLNRIFRFVVEKLWRLTANSNTKQILSELKRFMEDVRLVTGISTNDLDSIKLNRTNDRYSKLLNLAKFFIENRSIQMAHGRLETFSIVFNMNYLFENFIAEFIRRNKLLIFAEHLQEVDIFPQARGTSRFLARSGDRNYFSLKPDIVFRRKDKSFELILDTKYKRIGFNKSNLGIAQSDFYQMHAYAHRYNCPRIILLYPQDFEAQTPFRKTFDLLETQIKIETATVNLQIDLTNKSDRESLVKELSEILGDKNGN